MNIKIKASKVKLKKSSLLQNVILGQARGKLVCINRFFYLTIFYLYLFTKCPFEVHDFLKCPDDHTRRHKVKSVKLAIEVNFFIYKSF